MISFGWRCLNAWIVSFPEVLVWGNGITCPYSPRDSNLSMLNPLFLHPHSHPVSCEPQLWVAVGRGFMKSTECFLIPPDMVWKILVSYSPSSNFWVSDDAPPSCPLGWPQLMQFLNGLLYTEICFDCKLFQYILCPF